MLGKYVVVLLMFVFNSSFVPWICLRHIYFQIGLKIELKWIRLDLKTQKSSFELFSSEFVPLYPLNVLFPLSQGAIPRVTF